MTLQNRAALALTQIESELAAFIATARTGYPAALRGLKSAIESNLKALQYTGWEIHTYMIKRTLEDALDSILTIWERSRE